MWVRSLSWEDPLEEGRATHSSVLAWRIPWTEEPGGLSPWGCKESGTIEATQHACKYAGIQDMGASQEFGVSVQWNTQQPLKWKGGRICVDSDDSPLLREDFFKG